MTPARKPYTNAAVLPIIGQPFANPDLKWEVRGYIGGTWFNVPFRTFAAGAAWLKERTAS